MTNGSKKSPLGLFDGFGIELEYMIAKSDTMNISPVADALMFGMTGNYSGEVDRPKVSWSNELVSHVLELKTSGPTPTLKSLDQDFMVEIRDINARLKKTGNQLLPTAMHPWMDPFTESKLWAHESNEVYEAYDRIFSCKGHGWSNLQSLHINLPFANDEEFGRLHAAIRMVLPLLPAIAASSPVFEGKIAPHKDARLNCYRKNQAKVPIIAGKIIPEAVFSIADYHSHLFAKIFEAIKPHDKDGILQKEWLNSRGAIARFDRNAIEIRVIDVQECPAADIAIASLVVSTVRALVEEIDLSYVSQKAWAPEPLANILDSCIENAENQVVTDAKYLRDLGFKSPSATAKDIWQFLFEAALARGDATVVHYQHVLRSIISEGTLASRITNVLTASPTREELRSVWSKLGTCLQENKLFHE